MDSTTKKRLGLYAAIKQNAKWRQEMAMKPERIGVIRKTPGMDMRYMPSRISRGVASVNDIVNYKTKH